MKYKIARAVQFDFHDSQKGQQQALRAQMLAIHLVRNEHERKEEQSNENNNEQQ